MDHLACDKGPFFQTLAEGQVRLESKMDAFSKLLITVAEQRLEMGHVARDIDVIKVDQKDLKTEVGKIGHRVQNLEQVRAAAEKSIWRKCGETAAMVCAGGLTLLVLWTLFLSLPSFLKFQKLQMNPADKPSAITQGS